MAALTKAKEQSITGQTRPTTMGLTSQQLSYKTVDSSPLAEVTVTDSQTKREAKNKKERDSERKRESEQ